MAPELDPVRPPSDDTHVAANLVGAEPLSLPGVKATLSALELATETEVIVGAAGTSAATAGDDAAEGVDVPTPFVAVTVHVYVYAALSVMTVMGLLAPLAVRVMPPSLETHVAE